MGDNESHDSNGNPLADQWTSTPDLVGSVLSDRYKVLQPLGDGGMARVYLAEHIVLRKPIALKVLKNRFCHDQNNVERFLREARAASLIRHENVVDIIDFGQVPGGSVYIAMELLDGQDLDRLLEQERRIPWHRTKNIIIQVVRALKAAHSHGIIHRDMKPSNCYLVNRESGEDFVKVLDFGIAKVSNDSDVSLTETGAVFGTAKYMAPEQACGESVDARTDVYAVGVMMYEFLTGDVPFDGDSFMRVLTRHINEVPVPPSQKAPEAGIPEEAEAIVMQALSKHPDHRYQSMADLEFAIAQIESPDFEPRWTPVSKSGPVSGPIIGPNNPTRNHQPEHYQVDDPYAIPPVVARSSRFTSPPPPEVQSSSRTSGFSRSQPNSPDSTIAISGMGGTELRSLRPRVPTTSSPSGDLDPSYAQDVFSSGIATTHDGQDEDLDDWQSQNHRAKKLAWIIGGACGSVILAVGVAFWVISPESAGAIKVAESSLSGSATQAIPPTSPATPRKSPLVERESVIANDPSPPDEDSESSDESDADEDHQPPSAKKPKRTSTKNYPNKRKKKSSSKKTKSDATPDLPQPDINSPSSKGGSSANTSLDDLKKAKLSASDIKNGLAKTRSQVKKCGSWATVKVQFTVDPTGAVTSARAQRPFNQSDVGRCVESLVMKARFPPTSQKIMSIRVESFKL